MKKKLLACKNDNYNGSSCPRCLIKQNFLDFPAYEFATEGVPSNCDTCGAELSWETIDVKKSLNTKLIAAIAAGVLIIGAVVFFIMRPSSVEEDPITTNEVVQEEADQTPIMEETAPTPKPEPTIEEIPKPPITKPISTTSASAPKGTQSLTLSGGNSYKGEVLNGKPHGLGTLYYTQSTLISSKDIQKRMADTGDYLTGDFYEGNVVSGRLFSKNNELKEVILIGR
jgi:hypothetical protein